MAKFIYRMQNILNIKFRLEEQAKIAYGVARAKLNQEEEKLQKSFDKKSYYEELTRSFIVDKINLFEVKNNENAIEITKYQIKVQLVAVKQAEQKLEIAREKLNLSMMERKTHEKLKENAFEEFKKELDAVERKEVDELVSFKYNKTTSSEEDN